MEQTKTCPRCGKEVLAVARKCKHCGYWFNEKVTPQKGFRHCPVCDEIIPDGSSSCPYCNELLTKASNITPTEKAPTTVTEQNQEKEKPKKKASAVIIWPGTALSLLLLLAAIAYFTSSDLDSRDNSLTAIPSPAMTDEYRIKTIAKKWNTYHQEQNANGLASLYGDRVYYYHEYYTPAEISESKHALFLKNPQRNRKKNRNRKSRLSIKLLPRKRFPTNRRKRKKRVDLSRENRTNLRNPGKNQRKRQRRKKSR